MTKITQLPVASTISDTGVFVIVDEGVTKQLSWQTLKTGGLKGDAGPAGPTGSQGPVGPAGSVATIAVGTVEVTTSTTATAVIATTSTVSSHITILDFVIPQGPKGDTGVVSWNSLNDSLIPLVDNNIDLGSSQRRWKNLFLSGESLYLGNTIVAGASVTATNTITNVVLSSAVNTFSVADGNLVKVGATFSGLPGMGSTVCLVTDVVGNTVTFTPQVTFAPDLVAPYPVEFSNSDGILIDGLPFGYQLPAATSQVLGGVKIGAGVSVAQDGTISVNTGTPYVLTTATQSALGGVKVGVGINLSADGTISVTTGAFALQTATSVVLGGVKIGSGIDISSSGTISVNTGLSLASSLTGSTLASNVTASSLTSLGVLNNLTVSGITRIGQTKEKFSPLTGATGVVTHDCTNGTIFVHSNPSANFTVNFTNVNTGTNEVVSFALLINQGSTPRIPTAVQINNFVQTLSWQGGITPTGNANKKDLVNFTVFLTTGTNVVLGSLSSYG